jgi:hypothetical protein
VEVVCLLFISVKLYEEFFTTAYDIIDILELNIKAEAVVQKEVAVLQILDYNVMTVLPSEHYYARFLEKVHKSLCSRRWGTYYGHS